MFHVCSDASESARDEGTIGLLLLGGDPKQVPHWRQGHAFPSGLWPASPSAHRRCNSCRFVLLRHRCLHQVNSICSIFAIFRCFWFFNSAVQFLTFRFHISPIYQVWEMRSWRKLCCSLCFGSWRLCLPKLPFDSATRTPPCKEHVHWKTLVETALGQCSIYNLVCRGMAYISCFVKAKAFCGSALCLHR